MLYSQQYASPDGQVTLFVRNMAHISRKAADLLKLAHIHPELTAHLAEQHNGPPPANMDAM